MKCNKLLRKSGADSEWRSMSIEEIASITTGGRNTQDRSELGLYPFYVRSQTVERIGTYSHDGEAVLTAGDGVGTGKVFHYVNGPHDVHQRVYRISDFDPCVLGKYFFYYFSDNFYARIMTMTAKSSVDSVRRAMIAQMEIPIPPFNEQRAIVAAISDAESLTKSLEELIAKKQQIKQGVMQELLTAKRRLPGFTRNWKSVHLRELGRFSKGRGIKRTEVTSHGLPCIRYGEIYTRYRDYVFEPKSHISLLTAQSALPIRTGDILFAGSGETADEIGRCVAYMGEGRAYAGGDTVVLTPIAQNSIFLAHLLNQPAAATQKARLGQGDAVVHIHARHLATVELTLPEIHEQNAIAAVLVDMDAELAELSKRLEKALLVKHGMRQQLLTGRIRLNAAAQQEAVAC